MTASTSAGARAPIGIFDSGVGGLTVVKEISRQLPHEDFVYFGDTARAPYGSKAGETVTRFTLECVERLLTHGIKALVVACNTASAFALPALKRRLSIPVLDVIQPGARAAIQAADQRPIGVIGTHATIQSRAYVKALRRLGRSGRVATRACPLLVPLVEEGWLDSPVTRHIIRHYLAPLLRRRIGSLILGCTHYPALKPQFSRLCGRRVTLIDSAEEVAKELSVVLRQRGLSNPQARPAQQRFLVTDVPEKFIQVGKHILGKTLRGVTRLAWGGMARHV